MFSLQGYRDLLTAFFDREYTCVDYPEAVPENRHLILRHDVDQSPVKALAVAEVEASLGVSATYFFLLRTGMYNVFSEECDTAIRKIINHGHRIGLHLDASLYPDHDLGKITDQEAGILENWFNVPVDTVSFHRPATGAIGSGERLGQRLNVYAERFVKTCGYSADSRGEWRYGHPLDHASVREGKALQLLTHPIWWAGEGSMSREQKLDAFVEERDRVFRDELARNCMAYKR